MDPAVESRQEIAVGQRCELRSSTSSTGLRASIKRYGQIAFVGAVPGLPDGEWVGVRLDKPLGKSDGTVNGVRVFACEPLHGAFVRREKVNTAGDFPVFASQAESLAHELDAYRAARDGRKQQEKQQRAHDLELSGDELVAAFWERFTLQEDRVRRQIGEFVEQRKQPTAAVSASAASEASKLNDMVALVNGMRDEAARASSLFLSPYDIRHTQIIIAKLLELIESTRQLIAPRKKFAFRARVRKPTAAKENEDDNNAESSPEKTHAGSSEAAEASKTELQLDELVFANKQNEVIVIDRSSFGHREPDMRRDLNFSHLTNCTILVCVETSAIRGDALKNCVLYVSPIYGSLWLEGCDGCDLFVACRQLRVHHSANTAFHLRIGSHPIIEDCHQMRFGPYRLQFDGLKTQLEHIGLQKDSGLWAKVNDFKWHRAQQSPNWSLCDPKQPLRPIPPALSGRISYE